MTQQTQENPYVNIAQLLVQGKQGLRSTVGVVAAASPLVVNADGMPLSGSDLRVNAALLARDIPVTLDGRSGTARFASELTVGTRVLLLTDDGQTYDVICRVVNA